jgi:hypothetical protein
MMLARCLLVPIEIPPVPMPTDDEVGELEAKLYLEHCAESAGLDMTSEGKSKLLLDLI